MKINPTISADAITGAVVILGRHVPELTPKSLVAAIRQYQPGTIDAPEKLLTKKEVAELLAVSLPTIDRWLKRGLIRATKIGGLVRVSTESVREVLNPSANAEARNAE